MADLKGTVRAVCMKSDPGVPKLEVAAIRLIEGIGVEGDYHAGKFVRHRYLAKKDPGKQNNRQVLLIDNKILSDLNKQGIHLQPGEMGENIIIDGIDLMALETGTRLKIGSAIIQLSEIRDPCKQLNFSHADVLKSVVNKTSEGIEYNAGVFAQILTGGEVKGGDPVVVNTRSNPTD